MPQSVASDARVERTRWRNAVAGAVLLLVVANVMSNRVLPDWAYVPWNVSVALCLVWIAHREVSFADMGFTNWPRGAAWGSVLFLLTLSVMLVAVWMPVFNDLYHDRRTSQDTVIFLYHSLLRIPLGTAFLEETAFRGVLPALFAVRWGVLRGCVAASVLFGLWHVLPAMSLNKINPLAKDVFGTALAGQLIAVTFGVVGTALAGLWWCWIRYRSGSVLSTMIAHVATNSIGYTISWWVSR